MGERGHSTPALRPRGNELLHTLLAIDRVTRAIEQAPNVEKVFSLTSVGAISSEGELLDVSPLIEIPLDPGALPAVRERALSERAWRASAANN